MSKSGRNQNFSITQNDSSADNHLVGDRGFLGDSHESEAKLQNDFELKQEFVMVSTVNGINVLKSLNKSPQNPVVIEEQQTRIKETKRRGKGTRYN